MKRLLAALAILPCLGTAGLADGHGHGHGGLSHGTYHCSGHHLSFQLGYHGDHCTYDGIHIDVAGAPYGAIACQAYHPYPVTITIHSNRHFEVVQNRPHYGPRTYHGSCTHHHGY